MILADENLHPRLIQSLRSANIEDEEVIALSKDPPRIILTEDKDFGQWVFAHHQKSISVILLRYDRVDLNDIIAIVLDLIKDRGTSLFGKYITVTRSKIRIREL